MFSLFDLLALVALAIFIFGAVRMANLELRIIALGNALDAASISTAREAIIRTLRGELEAHHGAYKTSEDTIRQLRATITGLHDTIGRLEGLAHPCTHDDAFVALQQTIKGLQRQLAAAESELRRCKAACDDKSARIRSLLADQQVQIDATGVEQAKIARLERAINGQNTSLWQLNVVRGQFDHVKALIHQLVAAGGLQMVVTVLFVGLLARFGGVDLAGLGIDHLKFESYFEYARALAEGLPCPLLPQDGFCLKGIQYPLSGLRVIGSRIVEPVTTFLAAGSAPPAPPAVLFAPTPTPAPFAIAAPAQHAPTPTSNPRPAASTSAPPFAAAAVSSGPPLASSGHLPASSASASASAAPTQSATNQTVSAGFQPTKRPGTFGISSK